MSSQYWLTSRETEVGTYPEGTRLKSTKEVFSMQTNEQRRLYEELELISRQEPKIKTNSQKDCLRH
jgi:hypothetical protein